MKETIVNHYYQNIFFNTTAYCLILHDQIITYNPFSGDVRKL
jgi:hypothetical protein